jgi:hypothetical protein
MPRPCRVLATLLAFAAVTACMAVTSQTALAAPTCPLNPTTNAKKSNKLFAYFPTAADPSFPAYAGGVSPAAKFDVADLDPAIGTTAALRDRIHDVIVDDYCELNVQALKTTTNPATLAPPPARRLTVAIGSDSTGAWGQADGVDTGDLGAIGFARVWAGTYMTCPGALPGGGGGCGPLGPLSGVNATLDRWAQAIGGTAAHEAGHQYGLWHTDDNPPSDVGQPGPAPLPGEDGFNRHLMPSGNNLTGEDRASFRRHFSDRTFGIMATNVGLTIETMHNWDLVNPNAAAARSLRIDFLSPLAAAPPIDWTWTGATSPWISPVVSGPMGTAVFKGTTYKRYRITWSTGNPAWTGTPGVVPGGGEFHVGATFTGVDFNVPDPIIIQNVTLLDMSSNPLTLHPRLPAYDAGTVDSADGAFVLNIAAPTTSPSLVLESARIYQLPRVAAIESMNGVGTPATFDQSRIRPWSQSRCRVRKLPASRRETARCTIAKLAAKPHVAVTHKLGEPGVVPCVKGVPIGRPRTAGDSPTSPDLEGPICAGRSRDPFPSTTVYVIATVVDPHARHWDPRRKRYVVGPVRSKVFYQFAGRRRPNSRG